MTILNNFRLFWSILDQSRQLWTLLNDLGQFWIVYDYFGEKKITAFDHNVTYCNILDPFEPFQSNLGHIGTFFTI